MVVLIFLKEYLFARLETCDFGFEFGDGDLGLGFALVEMGLADVLFLEFPDLLGRLVLYLLALGRHKPQLVGGHWLGAE